MTIRGRQRDLEGRTYHLHQLDGVGLEAMVYVQLYGVRIEWGHGHGDCAMTGNGDALLAVLRGQLSAAEAEAAGRLVLYGDRDLIRIAPEVFKPRPGEFPGSDIYSLRLNPVSGPLIVAMARAGATPADIASTYAVDLRTVSRWKRRLGFEWQPQVNPGKRLLPEFWASTRTLPEVGEELGVTRRTISRWARELGLPRRKARRS